MNRTLNLENSIEVASKMNEYNGPSSIGSIGQVFKTARERLGFSVEDVTQKTYIKKHYIQALEEDRFEMLPAYVYTIGYIRTYANLLNLDHMQLVSRYQERFGNKFANKENLAFKDKSSPLDKPKVINDIHPKTVVNMEEYHELEQTGRAPFAQRQTVMNRSLYIERQLDTPMRNNFHPEMDMVNTNRQQAQEIINSAQQEAKRLRQGAEQYADHVLSQIEQEITSLLSVVRNGKAYIKNKKHQ